MKKRTNVYICTFLLTLIILAVTYKYWFTSNKDSISFNFSLFFIIAILSYLVILKIIHYFNTFKNIQHSSRIDIVFLLIFFTLLFIPMSKINHDVISEKENRKLAEYKPFFIDDKNINYNFGKDFEDWYNDRFRNRDMLVSINDNINSLFGNIVVTKHGIYNKKTHWMFTRGHLHNELPHSKEHSDKIISIFNDFNDFCEKNQIKLYVLIVPTQAHVYTQEAAPYNNPLIIKSMNDTTNYIKDKSSANIIYAYDDLIKNSEKDYTYFKTDWHWTDYGAYIGYRLLINEISKDFPEMKPYNKDDFIILKNRKVRSEWDRKFHDGGILDNLMPQLKKDADKILNVDYEYFEHKNKHLLQTEIIDISNKKQKNFYYPYGSDLRVIQMGTSMNENLTQFTPFNFKHLRYLRLNEVKDRSNSEIFKIMKYYKEEIIDYKPDILIFCITNSNLLYEFENFFKD